MPNSRSSHIPSNLSHGVLRNTAPPGGPLGRVVHRREVMSLLGVCPRTVDNLRARGLLMPVYGIGRKVIGYTEASVRGLAEVGKTASRTEGGE